MDRLIQRSMIYFLIIAYLSIIKCLEDDSSINMDCFNIPNASQTVKLFTKSKKGVNSEWVDSFAALADTSIKADNLSLEVTHKVAECGERRLIYIQGIANRGGLASSAEKLTFHPKSGKNVAISNKGRTAQKIDLNDPDNGVVFTNRPLKDNEIFEVRLEKKHSKFSYSLGFGICTSSPDSITVTPHMWTSPIAWMVHHQIIYNNGKEVLKGYGRNINELQVGDRIGVMRNDFGAVHFFINGVDQGPAVSNVPQNVYGVLDLYYNAAKATIMEAEPINS